MMMKETKSKDRNKVEQEIKKRKEDKERRKDKTIQGKKRYRGKVVVVAVAVGGKAKERKDDLGYSLAKKVIESH
eukprot:m.39186 g.39186  ORF g.39186 m.39186 type:complete len:74 (-) comp6846_c0_seq1:1509-1730(-)